MRRKTVIGIVCAILVLAGAAGIYKFGPLNAAGSVGADVAVDRDVDFSEIRTLGRTYAQDGLIWFDNTNSGFEFVLSGRGTVYATFVTDAISNPMIDPWIGVYINDEEEPERWFPLQVHSTDVTLYENTRNRPVTIRIEKLSELMVSGAALAKLHITGTGCDVEPTEPKDTLIEFIGDSITSGYGIMSGSAEEPFVTQTQDGSKTFAALTARALDADIRTVSWSGSSVSYAYDDNVHIIDVYRKGAALRSEEEYDFDAQRPADYVVINIGTNDGPILRSDPAQYADRFREDYNAFLAEVRDKNPEAHIICTLGPMDYTAEPYIEECFNNFAASDGNVSYLTFAAIDAGREGLGAGNHPTDATHERMAELLIKHIKGL